MSKPFSRRSAEGAALLDEKYPGWDKKIDLDKLNMGNSTLHVLGQLYGSYAAGLVAIGLRAHATESDSSECYRLSASYGFCNIAGTDALTDAWRDRICERLSVAA